MFIIISHWRFFKKLGYKGWYSIIPIYRHFCIFEALYDNGWRAFLPVQFIVAATLLSGMCLLFMNNSLKTSQSIEQMQNAIKYWSGSIIVIVFACLIAITVFAIKYVIDLTHAFGKKGWWTLGTLFFYPIMKLVYGISDLCFVTPFPDYENYDAIDGFIEFFRNQNPLHKSSKIKRCTKCGAVLRDNAKFCYECGAAIKQ
ncbi:MAG: zinc ribbon domain-containing protein [Erysipelotrichaceae bacterium]|nr:zinc ribbon domain-containing protein [Erysipelotrichaceae bacterium]